MSAALSLDNSEVVRNVLQVMGQTRTASQMDAALEADVRGIIRSGLRRFFFPIVNNSPYTWRFLEKWHPIPIEAKYDTGTIAVSGGTIKLTGGTWPTDLTNYFVSVSGHVLFITVRDGDTTATTNNSQLTVASGTSYEAYKYRYSLPSDFGEWLGGLVYADGTDSRMLANSSEPEIRLRYAIGQGTSSVSSASSDTIHYAVTSTPDSVTQSILFWPVPQPDAYIQGIYLSVPEDNLPADLTTPGSVVQVKPIYAEAVMESILAAAEDYNDGTPGIHAARQDAAIRAAIQHDSIVGGHYDFSHRRTYGRGIGEIQAIDFSSQQL